MRFVCKPILVFLGVFALSCRTAHPGATLKTADSLLREPVTVNNKEEEDTKTAEAILRLACRDVSELDIAEYMAASVDLEKELCACLAAKASDSEGLCDNGALRLKSSLNEFYHQEFEIPFLVKLKALNISNAAVCAKSRMEQKLDDALLSRAISTCQAGEADALAQTLRRKTMRVSSLTKADGCWRFRRLDAEGCIIAEPCSEAGASLAALPLSVPSSSHWQGAIKLCNEALSAVHLIKDPGAINAFFSDPILYFMAGGTYYGSGTFGFPNCHGTALALQKPFLADIPVKKASFRNAGDEQTDCRSKAETILQSAADPQGSGATIASLSGRINGVGITQMIHEHCGAADCGEATLYMDSCQGANTKPYVDIKGMCIDCWAKKAEAIGYHQLSGKDGPDALLPGCFLSQNDHTTTVVGHFGDLCYTYEATTPWGPPVLNVNSCLALWTWFSLRLCPQEPMTFHEKRASL